MAVALALLWATACKPSDGTPEGAVRELLQAAASGHAPRVYELLASSTQTRLEELAGLATAQTGGRRKVKPADLVAVTIDPPEHHPAQIERVSEADGRARVRLMDKERRITETFEVVREQHGWRVLLPDSAFPR